MSFRDPIIGGAGTLIRQAIKSPNYDRGVAGWSINKDGSAEFSDVVVRGDLITGPFDAGLYKVETFPVVGPGGAAEGTEYRGPDPGTVGTPAHLWLTQAYPSVTIPASFQSWAELYASHGIRYESPTHTFVGDIELNGGLFMPGGGVSNIHTDVGLRINNFTGGTSLRAAGVERFFVDSASVSIRTSPGIHYQGTNGAGNANRIGFKWGSPNVYARVDNVVTAIVGVVSDTRLKSHQRPLTGALARLKKLKPVDFLPIDLEGNLTISPRRPGLIAQDVELVEPWAVPPVEHQDEFKTVDYLGLIALLVQAVNELGELVPSNQEEQ